MTRPMIFWLALLLIFGGTFSVWSALKLAETRRGEEPGSIAVPVPRGSDEPILKEFTLTERTGRPFSSRDLRGEVWVASFFFASCPGSCRSQNLELMALQNEYAKKGVKFVSITCDPLTDTPAKLREYADSFQARPDAWYFLTGDLKYIRRIGAEIFNVYVDERGHMDRFMTVDKWGHVRGHFDWHDRQRLAEMKQMLDKLLAETEPPDDLAPVMAVPSPFGSHPPKQDSTEPEANAAPEQDARPTEQVSP